MKGFKFHRIVLLPVCGALAFAGVCLADGPTLPDADVALSGGGASQGQQQPYSQKLSDGIEVPKRPEIFAILNEFNTIGRTTVSRSIDRAGRYLPLIKRELELLNLPLGLAVLPMVESHYTNAQVSPSGAVGLWQFIESTAKNYNLRVDWWVDQRLDPVASTRAAATHLSDLYSKFGDWELVLAAYNSGAGCVERAVKGTGFSEFWDLCRTPRLSDQTKRYVAKFYAALSIMDDPVSFGYAPSSLAEPFDYDVVRVDSPVDLMTLAGRAGIPFEEVRALNPELKRGVTPPGDQPFELKVSKGLGPRVSEALAAIPEAERLDFKRHKVLPGETVSKIAAKYKVDVGAIASLNRISAKKKLKAGSELVIPQRKGGGSEPSPLVPEDASFHLVAKGDTLWNISKRYGVEVEELKRLNSLDGAALSIGQRLSVAKAAERPKPPPQEHFHVVERGDTLSSIARKSGVSLSKLKELNRLGPRARLMPGDRILTAVK